MSCDVLEHSELHRFHDEYFVRNRPVVLRGLRDHNPRKIFDWSAAYFDDVLGDAEVPVLVTETSRLTVPSAPMTPRGSPSSQVV